MLSICLLVLGYYFCHGENLVANGDFLQLDANGKPAGWRGSVHPDSGPDTGIRPEGRNSYRLTGDQLLSTTVRGIKPGHVYDCSFILKTEGFKWRTAASFQILSL